MFEEQRIVNSTSRRQCFQSALFFSFSSARSTICMGSHWSNGWQTQTSLNEFNRRGVSTFRAWLFHQLQNAASLWRDCEVALKVKIDWFRITCFFVFDQDASIDLNNNIDNANLYADKLADLASRYMAHANIVVVNAGTEMWSDRDRISFAPGSDPTTSSMPDFLTRFQAYLASTQSSRFGSTYAVGVLLSGKATVAGGYSQGPPCTTSGASLIKYRSIPWVIGGLIAHELAHTLSVVHTFELFYVCQAFPNLSFCSTPNPPDECNCASAKYPPEQCLMTYSYGRAVGNAPRYTPCDIEMMNRFSSNIACLIKVRPRKATRNETELLSSSEQDSQKKAIPRPPRSSLIDFLLQ